MTAKQAKEETLEVWRYLAEHPEINNKDFLPVSFDWLDNYVSSCPLCEYNICSCCILKSCGDDSLYDKWCFAETIEERQQAALAIVKRVEEWEVKE
jgi:hypothetical protein